MCFRVFSGAGPLTQLSFLQKPIINYRASFEQSKNHKHILAISLWRMIELHECLQRTSAKATFSSSEIVITDLRIRIRVKISVPIAGCGIFCLQFLMFTVVELTNVLRSRAFIVRTA